MELRLLKYFQTVCEELHFTRAAEKLGISQPTLSQQIRLLESQLEDDLFLRVGKKIELTAAGTILLEHVNRIFLEMEIAKEKIQELKGLNRGQLRIGTSGNHLLYASLLSFHQQYPNIKLSVFDLTTEETVLKILNSELDMGVVFLPIYHQQLETIPLFSSELSVAVSITHPFAEKEEIQLEELQSQPIFLLPEHYLLRQSIDKHCLELGFTLNPIVELSDIYSLVRMTILHNGATILPRQYLNGVTDLPIKLVKISDSLPIKKVGIIYRQGDFIPYAIQAFIHHLTTHYIDDQTVI
ncbi:LysR substrate-binding domain-containing protein [Sporosarcina sp. ACRSM]|uniref:LysR substrate-binding domain-containing protein n=1 Tax=Sporosarcina sp. ACRSM TaxID=2918216 RepID=UPI001EF6AB35|nr:LysR substrate-binding domain-containing protein [Sporosarcina sp. ACRSM]MCG7336303.1 LysR substrate-binding domain-containing protein [Sporosarcina sp. ACRSM]